MFGIESLLYGNCELVEVLTNAYASGKQWFIPLSGQYKQLKLVQCNAMKESEQVDRQHGTQREVTFTKISCIEDYIY